MNGAPLLAGVAAAILLSAACFGQSRVDDIADRVPRRESSPVDSTAAPPALEDGRQADPGPQQTFVLAAVVFEGGSVFRSADLAPAYESYLTKPVSLAEMAGIAEAVTRIYREAGYVLCRAVVPPQSGEGGVLRLQIAEGYISDVEVTGPAREAVARRFDAVTRERPLRLRTLDRALGLAGDLAGVSIVRSALAPDPENLTTYRLVVETSHDASDTLVYADNRGVGQAGAAQGYLSSSLNGLLRPGDRATVGVFAALKQPQDLMFGELGYQLPLGPSGATLSVYGSYSDAEAGASLSTPALDVESRRILVHVAHPFIRGRSFTLRGDAGIEQVSLQERRGGAMSFEDELRIVDVGVSAIRTDATTTTTLDVRLAAGLEAFGASTGGTGPLSRSGADGEFTLLRLFASHYRDLGGHFGVYSAVNGQISSDPLLATEAYTFGGAQFGRAYGYARLSGDDGLAGSVELRYGRDPSWRGLDFYQVYGFYDAGWIWNHGEAAYVKQDQAASAGLGLRLTIPGETRLDIEAAKPLSHAPGGSDAGWRGFVSLSSRF